MKVISGVLLGILLLLGSGCGGSGFALPSIPSELKPTTNVADYKTVEIVKVAVKKPYTMETGPYYLVVKDEENQTLTYRLHEQLLFNLKNSSVADNRIVSIGEAVPQLNEAKGKIVTVSVVHTTQIGPESGRHDGLVVSVELT